MTAEDRIQSGPYALRGMIPAYQLAQDFISDEIVYVVQGVEINTGKSRLLNAERYLNGDEWFKVFLHIHTDRHLGEYVATIERALPRRVLDDSGHGRHCDLIRHQMESRVLEAIVQSGKDGERVAVRTIASMVRLYIINQGAYRGGNINEAGIVNSDSLTPGLLSSDREALRLHLLSDAGNTGADQVVENRSQMVNGFVSEQGDRGWSINELKAVEVVRTIGIYLAAEGPWITRRITPDDPSQMAQVLTCPTEFDFKPVWSGGVYCGHGRQEADAKDAEGYEIPVPKRSDFDKALDAVAKPKKSRPRRRSPCSIRDLARSSMAGNGPLRISRVSFRDLPRQFYHNGQ